MARAPGKPRTSRPEIRRFMAATAVIVLHAALLALLLRPVLITRPQPVESLVVVNVPVPPPPVPEPEPDLPEPAAAAAPPAPTLKPRPVAAPLPPAPTPTPVAQAPSNGIDTASGSASAGTGTGAAGAGAGTGAGGTGLGGGGGKPRWKSGTISRRDYPADASRTGATGSVTARLEIAPYGRVTGCTIVRSSGTPSLDATTCRLAKQRFRFEPARDAAGNAVPGTAGWRQDWWLEPPR